MNLGELLDRLRFLMETNRVQRRWTDSELVIYLNDAQEYMRALKIEADPDYYLDMEMTSDIGLTLTAEGTGMYSLVLPEYMEYVRRIEAFGTSGTGFGTPVEQAKLRDHQRSSTWSYFEGVYGIQTWMYGGPRKLFFATADAADNMRIWFVRRAPKMVRFTAQQPVASPTLIHALATAGSLVGKLDKTDDYYVGATMEISTKTAGPGDPEGETRRVTAYARDTYPSMQFTTEAFSANVSTGDICDILPSVEEMHQELLVYLAAQRALAKAGNRDQIDALQVTKGELLSQYLTTANDRFDSTPDHVSWPGDDMR